MRNSFSRSITRALYAGRLYNDSNGVVTHLTWRTEEAYRAVAAFLKNLPGQGGLIPGDPEKPEFYIVETQE